MEKIGKNENQAARKIEKPENKKNYFLV